jgi:hypothetical protein
MTTNTKHTRRTRTWASDVLKLVQGGVESHAKLTKCAPRYNLLPLLSQGSMVTACSMPAHKST